MLIWLSIGRLMLWIVVSLDGIGTSVVPRKTMDFCQQFPRAFLHGERTLLVFLLWHCLAEPKDSYEETVMGEWQTEL